MANLNLVQAKALAESDHKSEIFEGRAGAVQRHRRLLTDAGVEFEIEPEFPYDLSVESNVTSYL